MNVLVIGGTGFIGLALCERLQTAGLDFTVYHRNPDANLPFKQFAGEREDTQRLRKCIELVKPDCIVHLCAMNGRHISALKSASDGDIRVVVVSSADVYKAFEVVHRLSDAPIQPIPLAENSPLRGVRNYRENYEKIDVESAANGITVGGETVSPLNAVFARLGMVYAANDPYRRFQSIADAMRKTDKISLPANVAAWRAPYVDVRNVADALLLLATKGKWGEAYNVANEAVFAELEWRRKIAEKIGWRGEIEVTSDIVDDLNFDQHLVLDTHKIRRELGYRDLYTDKDIDFLKQGAEL